MAINGKVVARRRPSSTVVKQYIAPKIVKVANDDDVAQVMCDGMTITREEALLAIKRMVEAVGLFLRNGHSVKISNLGTFSLSFTCEGADRVEDLTVNNVKKINTNLRFVNEFREKIQKTEIVLDKEKKN